MRKRAPDESLDEFLGRLVDDSAELFRKTPAVRRTPQVARIRIERAGGEPYRTVDASGAPSVELRTTVEHAVEPAKRLEVARAPLGG